MNRACRSRVAFGAVMTVCLGVLPASAADEEPSPQARKNQTFYAGRSELAQRSNGVLMTVEVQVEQREGKPDEIRFDWTLEYDGPRPPLIILAPSLERQTSGQTEARFYAEGAKDERPYEFTVKSPPSVGFSGLEREWFITIPKGEKRSGRTSIPADVLWEHYRPRWPAQFVVSPPPVLHVQFRHRPLDQGGARGAAYEVDAWTGQLWSPVIPVPLKVWAPPGTVSPPP